MFYEVGEDNSIVDLFDDVGDVVFCGIPQGSHAFIVLGDVVGGPAAPFTVDSVEEVYEGTFR